jgi:hypothetical protein
MSGASVQVRLDLASIRQGVACFGSGAQAEYCAVVEVAGSQQSLAKVDEAKQEELLAAYAQFLNALTFPFQLVVQVRPVDLGWYVTRVEERARSLSPALVAIARDHAAFVQSLARRRTLLERRIYVVVPWSDPATHTRTPLFGLKGLRRLTRGSRAVDDVQLNTESIGRQLADRCEEVARQLGRAGLRTTRLDDLSLARLYQASWAPEPARTQRLRQELSDYTALVVGPEARNLRSPLGSEGDDGFRDDRPERRPMA